MHSEFIAYVESTMREIDFSDDALGIDQIKANALRGTYIDTMHTAGHFRKELWFPRLLDRNYYDAWRESGALSMQERCRLRKEEILRDHKPEPVSDDLEAALDEVVAAAKKDLGS